MLNKAIDIATRAHSGQVRKVSGLPYIVHPLDVMNILINEGVTDEEILSAAVLHDVIEDCEPKYIEEFEELGSMVFFYVISLTKFPDESSEEYTKALLSEGRVSVLIKMADIMSNTRTKMSNRYMSKKLEQLKALFVGVAEADMEFYYRVLEQVKSHGTTTTD